MDIESNPSQRVYQDRLSLFKQETAVVKTTLTQQCNTFKTLMDRATSQQQTAVDSRRTQHHSTDVSRHHATTVRRQQTYYNDGTRWWDDDVMSSSGMPISATDPGGLRGLLIKDCIDFAARRSADFDQLDAQVGDLEDMVSYSASTTAFRGALVINSSLKYSCLSA